MEQECKVLVCEEQIQITNCFQDAGCFQVKMEIATQGHGLQLKPVSSQYGIRIKLTAMLHYSPTITFLLSTTLTTASRRTLESMYAAHRHWAGTPSRPSNYHLPT